MSFTTDKPNEKSCIHKTRGHLGLPLFFSCIYGVCVKAGVLEAVSGRVASPRRIGEDHNRN